MKVVSTTEITATTGGPAKAGTCEHAQAGEARLTDVLEQGGFTRVRRATETPFNLILEARP